MRHQQSARAAPGPGQPQHQVADFTGQGRTTVSLILSDLIGVDAGIAQRLLHILADRPLPCRWAPARPATPSAGPRRPASPADGVPPVGVRVRGADACRSRVVRDRGDLLMTIPFLRLVVRRSRRRLPGTGSLWDEPAGWEFSTAGHLVYNLSGNREPHARRRTALGPDASLDHHPNRFAGPRRIVAAVARPPRLPHAPLLCGIRMNLLLDSFPARLTDWLAERGEPAYRADQIRRWLFAGRVGTFADMTDLPSRPERGVGRCSFRSGRRPGRFISGRPTGRKSCCCGCATERRSSVSCYATASDARSASAARSAARWAACFVPADWTGSNAT